MFAKSPKADGSSQIIGGAGFSLLGADTTIAGNVVASCDLHLDGRVDGDVTCTGAVESGAATLDEIVAEVAAARQTERGTRADDQRSESAMEDRKKEGYF